MNIIYSGYILSYSYQNFLYPSFTKFSIAKKKVMHCNNLYVKWKVIKWKQI